MIQTLAVYVHRLDPFALGPFGGFGIRWYGLSYLAGFIVGFLVIRAFARRGLSPLKPELAGDFIMSAAIGTIVGGRAGYCLFYQPALLTDFSSSFPYWGLLAINNGGMASHGGMIGLVLSCIWFARKHRLPSLHLMDLIGLTAPIGVFFGRLANFVNGELLGRPCQAGFAWAVKFPQELLDWGRNHPAFASRDFQEVVEMANAANANAGIEVAPSLIDQVVTAVRHDDAVAQALSPFLVSRHPSQLYEAVLEGLVVFACLLWIWRRPRKPGLITAWFFLIYGVCRILGEQFRMPDAHIGYEWLGLTRGQWLSFGLLAFGAFGLFKWSRRSADLLGGWAQKKGARESAPVHK